jgi:hypothetical protein
MTIVHPTSLDATLDAAAETFFYQQPLPTPVREEIAALIIRRQCQSGVNSGFFIPFTAETESKGMLYSGEQLRTSFAQTHIRLLEAARILKLIAIENHGVSQALHVATERMKKMCYSKFCAKGECKALTIAYLRYLATDSKDNPAPQINNFLTLLVSHRDGKGKWGGFPFFFTLLMLTEVDDPQALKELKYSVQVCNKYQAGKWNADPISKRRQAILTKALARS